MRDIDFTKNAQKYIGTLVVKHQKQIIKNILALRENVQPQDSKKLHGSDYYRIDSGEYRIVYDWSNTVVFLLLVGKRNDGAVYKKLKRK
jgi:mRNA interferase RelE/StbE